MSGIGKTEKICEDEMIVAGLLYGVQKYVAGTTDLRQKRCENQSAKRKKSRYCINLRNNRKKLKKIIKSC